MKLKELRESLAVTSLHSSAISDLSKPENVAQLNVIINRAVKKIYMDLAIDEDVSRYYPVVDKTEYDLPEDFMREITALDIYGDDIPINKDDSEDSLFINGTEYIYIPELFVGTSVDLIYLASPEKVSEDDDRIPLGPQYEEALSLYVAYLANELINGAPNWEHQSFLTKYKNEINNLISAGLVPQSRVVNQKIRYKGFV